MDASMLHLAECTPVGEVEADLDVLSTGPAEPPVHSEERGRPDIPLRSTANVQALSASCSARLGRS